MPNNPRSTTGGEVDNESEAFSVQTLAPSVSFDMEDVDPPAANYIGVNDRLLIMAFGGSVNTLVTFNATILRPDGQIIPYSTTFGTAGSNIQNSEVLQLMEGFILSASMQLTNSISPNQSVYASLSLVRPPYTISSVYKMLCAGYVSPFVSVGFPQSPPQRMTDGAGVVSVTPLGNPSAGADWTFTCASRARQRLVSLCATLTTSAVAANRDVVLVIDNGAIPIAQIPAGFALAASGSNVYTFGDSLVQSPAFNGVSIAPTPSQLFLSSNWRVRTVTGNIQAADQWSAITVGTVDWIEATS